jgi:hypothetical protein
LNWQFQERDVRKIIEAIEREKSLLALAMSKDSGKLLHKIKACAERNSAQLTDLLQATSIASENAQDHFDNITRQISDVQSQTMGLQNGIERLQSSGDTSEASKTSETILNWLTSDNHATKHYNILSKRQEGT